MAVARIVITEGKLIYYDQFGFEHIFDYTSGRNGVYHPRQPDVGPIPEGKYSLKVEDIAGGWIYFLYWELYKGEDWGVYRVPIEPEAGTNTLNRYGFSLHGGIKLGSAGCIDVGTPNDLILFGLMKLSFQEVIELEVKY